MKKIKKLFCVLLSAIILMANTMFLTEASEANMITIIDPSNMTNTVYPYGNKTIYINKNGDVIYEDSVIFQGAKSFNIPNVYFYGYGFIIDENDSLYSFGINASGVLGEGTGNDQEVPVHIHDNVRKIYTYENAAFALTANNELYAWGNSKAWHGDGVNVYSPLKIFDNVNDIYFSASVTSGYYLSHLLMCNGDLRTPYSENVILDNVRYFTFNKNLDDSWSGVNRSYFAIKNDYSLWSWGGNTDGECGLGDTDRKDEPLFVDDNVIFVSSCASGTSFSDYTTHYIKTDGTLYGMGNNTSWYCSVGDGTKIDRYSPVIINGINNVVYVEDKTAITADGKLYIWERNMNNQTGSPVMLIDDMIVWYNKEHFITSNGEFGFFSASEQGTANGETIYRKYDVQNVKIPILLKKVQLRTILFLMT